VAATPQEIYQRYLWATLTPNTDAVAEMFTVDGVLQAPLVRVGQAFPRHLEGREAIRTGDWPSTTTGGLANNSRRGWPAPR
jgi:hypothetical protein